MSSNLLLFILLQALEVTVWRDGKECHQSYTRGKPHKPLECNDLPANLGDHTGTCIKFWPDAQSTSSLTLSNFEFK